MLVVRFTIVLAALLALAMTLGLVGCEPDRTGTAKTNAAPKVTIVNTPPDGAQFSRNPELNWFATDIDGFISFFRYSIVVDSMLQINGSPVTPEQFITQATDAQFGWDTLLVDLDHPQSSATLRLFADTQDPVNTFVSQYFFVQAEDDRGAMSEVVFRNYSRNNHYPNTHHRYARAMPFINAIDANSAANGIQLTWYGADSLDWGRTEPPLDYEWRLFGPFDLDEDVYLNSTLEDCDRDPTSGEWINCREVHTLDLDALPDTIHIDLGNGNIISKAQPIARSQGPNFANDPTDVWVTDREATIFNVFEGLNLVETSEYKFVFWVRARDDGFVPDPTPAFSQFTVVEALFERDVAVIDETYYSAYIGTWMPRSLDTTKSIFNNMIHEVGYNKFDTLVDYFWFTAKKSRFGVDPVVPNEPDLLDVLSYKTIVFYTDAQTSGYNSTPSGLLRSKIYFAMDMGVTVLMMARNITGIGKNLGEGNKPDGIPIEMSGTFQNYFGIKSVTVEGWNYWVLARPTNLYFPQYMEEFIAAYPVNAGEFPLIELDYGNSTSLMETRYGPWQLAPGMPTHTMQGLPEVGVCNKMPGAAPLFLFYSKHGQVSPFHGKVCAVRNITEDTRTSVFLFTPLAMDPDPMTETMEITLDWLMEKFSTVAPAAKPGINYTGSIDLTHRQQKVQDYLDYIEFNTTDEEKAAFGIKPLKPFVVH